MARPRLELERSVRDPGFTPSVRDVGALVALLADEELAKHAERAIARAGPGALPALRQAFAAAVPPLRARVVRAIGRFASEAEASALLVAALDDADPKTRRNAVIALGHATSAAEEALLGAWERDARPEMRRSIAAALGKIGTARSLGLLRAAAAAAAAAGAEDADLARIATQAAMMVERTGSRAGAGRLDPDRSPARPVAVVAWCRSGIEDLLAEELRDVAAVSGVEAAGRGRVRAMLRGPMQALFEARTMTGFGFPVPAAPAQGGEPFEEAVARAVAGPEARRIASTWTEGAVRYRIAWAEGGHRRALAWRIAVAVARRVDPSEWVNDPTASLWELVSATTGGTVDLALVPRALPDPRFTWRRRDVPAASHPTIAAALARVAGVREGDVVWDPFVGSGAELVERAIAGRFASLEGSDVDPAALDAARENLATAGVRARLHRADALAHAPDGVTLVLTNPPMGRRAARTPGLQEMLDRFVEHAAARLVPGGRLVWIAPWPERTRRVAERAGLALEWWRDVDMGGFEAQLQRWTKGRARRGRSAPGA